LIVVLGCSEQSFLFFSMFDNAAREERACPQTTDKSKFSPSDSHAIAESAETDDYSRKCGI
jgi:hypothetical protein